MKRIALLPLAALVIVACEDATNPVNEHGPRPRQPLYSASGGATSPEILFRTDRDGNVEMYGIDSDGTGLVRLTDTPETEQLPSWSPDRRKRTEPIPLDS